MFTVPENIKQNLNKVIPSSAINEIACFVFYDNHPRDPLNIDITICTLNGMLIEYYKREELFSIPISISKPLEIKILRNSKGELFYLVAAVDNLVIISRKEKLYIHQEVNNVDYYDINDTVCRGQAYLKIVRKDDAVPLVFDDNFENLGESALMLNSIHADDSLPILTQLMRKLTEAKYSVKCNEKTLKDFLNLRQISAFYSYQKMHPNVNDSVYKLKQNLADSLKLKTQAPWIILCNQKIVVVLNVYNKNDVSAEDVHILLHGSTRSSIVYTTKVFEKTVSSPFWIETKTNQIRSNTETAVVTVIALEEIKHHITSRIEFHGVLFFKKEGKEHMVPLDDVFITAKDMSVNYDVLSSNKIGEPNATLAILAATEKIKLVLRHIKNNGDPNLVMQNVFCQYLEMEEIPNIPNGLIHRRDAYHTLNGLMVLFEDDVKCNSDVSVFHVTVYARSSSQVLTLIHWMYECIPYKIIATPPNHKITSKIENLSRYNEDISSKSTESINCEGYASSIVNQSTTILEYLDFCNVKMTESKDPVIQNKIGIDIDLFAGGVDNYLIFKKKMVEEASRGIKSIDISTENT